METRDKTGKLLFSINEVFSDQGYLKEKSKQYYNIPLYQRGYKWEAHNVQKLLNDVDNFEAGDEKFYCLQNITIVACDDYFNVIDGQQRLTTLTIILSYLNEKRIVFQKVRFPDNSIRKYTNSFLNEVVTKEEIQFPNDSWDDFASKQPHYDLQDIGHIYNVYHAVKKWFVERVQLNKPFDKEKFVRKLLYDVKLIVNEVDGQTSEEKVFGNLNSKRIPLDGSDLIRAILITRVAKEEANKESDLKNIVYVNERRVKLGWELDQINNWWGNENIKGYFNSFISTKSEFTGGDKKLFNEVNYPINLLYLLYAESKGREKLTLDLIEEHSNSAIELYKSILKIHYTLQDWYEDKEIYHYLGFLFNIRSKKEKFLDIWKLWDSASERSEFVIALKLRIRAYFVAEDNQLINFTDLNTNWYDDKQDELVRSLVLMDVIHSIKKNQANLPYNRFWKSSDDIEHIFPQNPKELKDKKAFIQFLNKSDKADHEKFDLSEFDQRKNEQEYMDAVEQFIESVISKIAINSIGNLVLLYKKLNQSISNNIYSVKRSRIIEHYNSGEFIQPHTFKVFTRDFNDNNQTNRDYEYWTNEDIKRTCAYIEKEITNFLKV